MGAPHSAEHEAPDRGMEGPMNGPDADNEDQQALREQMAQACDGLALIAEVSATTVDCLLNGNGLAAKAARLAAIGLRVLAKVMRGSR